jgi:hypothetical protein
MVSNKLVTARELKLESDRNAKWAQESELQFVAQRINTSASKGWYYTVISIPLFESTQNSLKELGYKIDFFIDEYDKRGKTQISW